MVLATVHVLPGALPLSPYQIGHVPQKGRVRLLDLRRHVSHHEFVLRVRVCGSPPLNTCSAPAQLQELEQRPLLCPGGTEHCQLLPKRILS